MSNEPCVVGHSIPCIQYDGTGGLARSRSHLDSVANAIGMSAGIWNTSGTSSSDHRPEKALEDGSFASTTQNLGRSDNEGVHGHGNPNEPASLHAEEPVNGRTAWLHAMTGMLVVFNCWGLGNAYGLFQGYYELAMPSANPSSIAWIGSTQLALVFGLGVPVGRLVDKGHFHAVFHSGTCLMVLGIFSTAWCHTIPTLWLTQGLITGMGMGMVFCAGMVALMTWFDQTKIGIAMGLAAAGSCIGGIVFIVLARHLLASQGFATTMCVLAVMVAATMIPANIVFRIRGEAMKHREDDTAKSAFTWRMFSDSPYLLAAAGMFFAFLGVYFGFVYIVSYGSTVLRLAPTQSTNLLIFMLAANLPGRFLPALLSDKCIGPLNTMIPSLFLSSAVLWLWAASEHTTASLTVIACYYGFVSAGVQVLYAPTVHSLCLKAPSSNVELEAAAIGDTDHEKLDIDRMGLRAGGIFTCIGLAALIGTPIGGALISFRTSRNVSSPYFGAQIFAAVSLLLGGILLLASRVSKIGWQARRA
jgi:MFS family permease